MGCVTGIYKHTLTACYYIARFASQGSAEGVLRVTGYLMDDVTDWLMRRLELLNVSNLVTLLPAAAGMTNARRRQLMHKLVEALREEVPKLRPDQVCLY